MQIVYDIEKCSAIISKLNSLLDLVYDCDQRLLNELAVMETTWIGDASSMFFREAYKNEEHYIKQLIVFRETLAALQQIHDSYSEAKDLADNKLREIHYG